MAHTSLLHVFLLISLLIVLLQATDMQNVYDLMDMALQKGRECCQICYHSLGMCSPLPFERGNVGVYDSGLSL